MNIYSNNVKLSKGLNKPNFSFLKLNELKPNSYYGIKKSTKLFSLNEKNNVTSTQKSQIVSSSFPVAENFLNETQPALHLLLKKEDLLKLSKLNLNKEKELYNSSLIYSNKNNNENKKKYYTSYSKLSEIKLLTIGIASPLRILQWAEKTLPNGKIYGEVLNANTLHHKTFKPQKGGLFCERIFGPLKDFECACGKSDKSIKKMQLDSKSSSKEIETTEQSILNTINDIEADINKETNQSIKGNRKFCPDCDVEYTWSVIRRYQIGYIKLSSPMTHIWFLKGTPSYLSLLLDIKKRHLQFVTYCSESLTIEKSQLPFYLNKESYLDNSLTSSTQTLTPGLNNEKTLLSTKNVRSTCMPKKGWHLNKKSHENLRVEENESFWGKDISYQPLILSTPNSTLPGEGKRKEKKGSENKEQFNLINKKGIFVLSSLLLSSYYKNLPNSVNNINTKTLKADKVSNLKKMLKNLPLDLYILSSLELLLHKSSLSLSISNTWEILYKRAFFKAFKKSKEILSKFVTSNKTSPFFFLQKKIGSLNLPVERDTQNLAFVFNAKDSDSSISALSALGILNKKSSTSTFELKKTINLRNTIKKNKVFLKNVKEKYTNHVLKSLKQLKYPITSINYTILFNKKNHFSQIEKQISSEISKFFLKNTEYYEKILFEFFIHSFLVEQFLHFHDKKYKINFSSFLNKNQTLSLDTLSVFPTFEKKNLKNNKVLKIKTLSTLNTYKKLLMLNKNNELMNSKLNLINNKQAYLLKEVKEKLESTKLIDNQNSLKNSNKRSKTKMYNNVYTLSHRERWDLDKDWYLFSLFTFGITDYSDYPISTYKDRLFSLTYSQDFNYLGFLSETKTLPLNLGSNVNLNVNGKQPFESVSKDKQEPLEQNLAESNTKQTSFSPTIKKYENPNTSKISASFIYSSSFYSGAGIVQQLLNEFDFNEIQKLDKQNRLLLYQINKSILKLKKVVQIFVYDKDTQLKLKELCKKRDSLIRRTKLVRKMYRKNTNPASMVLTVLPVLPPDLRPIVKMGNQIAASDLNRLYQRVIYRNDRLKKFLKDPATSQSYEMKYAQRLLQEAVDNLLQNGKSGPNSEKDARGRALKSLSDILKGKQGRFRQFLLGKRVDYSGRSVIVVGPKLKLHECGLPLEMAKELYLPFLLKSILNKNYAKTVIGAKTLMQNNPALANELLHEIMQVTPILLNRAPTLHRLGIQAFVPKLIEGRAILLHPLVCSAFNADFDGDQMAVHVPITIEARAEAWKIMLSRNNLLSPATGEPLAIPSQDMVLGCYYLTTFSAKSKNLRGSGMYFNHLYDVIKLYEQNFIDIHAFVWLKWTHLIQNGNDYESPLEIRVSTSGKWQEITSNYQITYDSNHNLLNLYMCTTPGRILLNLIIQELI